jgi:hypothetical protein
MSSPISDWICCRLVDAGRTRFPRPKFWIGQVEFLEGREADERCVSAMARSMDAHAIADSGAGASRILRTRVLIPSTARDEAEKASLFHLRETVEAFNAHISLLGPELKLLGAGYTYDIQSRECRPLLPKIDAPQFAFTAFIGDALVVHPLHVLNTLYAADATAYGVLGSALRRSAHWRSLAAESDDAGQALLFQWMAAECLCKEDHDENIEPKLMAAAGFPGGRFLSGVDGAERRRLTALPSYQGWREQLAKHVNAMRLARNRIVHEGFRYIDLPDFLGAERSAAVERLLPLIAKSLADMALMALATQVVDLRTMWDNYPRGTHPEGLVRHASWYIDRLRG